MSKKSEENNWFGEAKITFEDKLRVIVEKALEQGQLIVVGTKQTGKTNATMWVLRNMMQLELHQAHKMRTIILDTVMQWRHKFDNIPYLKHDSVRILPIIKDLIIDMTYWDPNRIRDEISDIVIYNFIKKGKLVEKFKGEIPFYDVYVIEEIQNVLGSYSMNGSKGKFWLKMVSECANYGIILIGVGQRFADISTRVVERTRYFLLGATSGDNDLRKIKRMTSKKIAEKVKNLQKYEFVFVDREDRKSYIIKFPKFIQTSKPEEYVSENGDNAYVQEILDF